MISAYHSRFLIGSLFRYFIFFSYFSCVYIVLSACGGLTLQPGGNPQGGSSNTQPAYSLSGDWIGIYKSKQIDKNEERETNAKVSIIPSGDVSGIFKLELPSHQKANVTGNYRDFAGKSLLLDIQSSNLSTLGLAGSKTDISYILVADTLELSNERFLLKLTREENSKQPNDQNKDQSSAKNIGGGNSFFGKWVCLDSSSIVWNINLNADSTFAIDINDKNRLESSTWMDGNIVINDRDRPQSANLDVTSSQRPDQIGKKFIFTAKQDGTATIVGDNFRKLNLNCQIFKKS